MTPLSWAVLVVALGAAVAVWWVSRRDARAGIAPAVKPADRQLDMFSATGQFDEFGVGKARKVAPSIDGAPTASQLAKGEVSQKIVALLIAEREGTHIFGPRIHAALRANGLQYGDKQIYHRLAEGEPVYSVASLLKPGFLDPAQEKTFSTPGLSIFLVLPGPLPAMTAFREMAKVAQALARELNAQVYDMRRKPLTPESMLVLELEVEQWARANPMH